MSKTEIAVIIALGLFALWAFGRAQAAAAAANANQIKNGQISALGSVATAVGSLFL